MSNVRQAREALGAHLRELRKDARLNGKQLAQRLGWLATKVSKIELGRQTPTEAEITEWADACEAPSQAPPLILQLRSLELAYASWQRQLRSGTKTRQQQIGDLEADVDLIRGFEVAMVPGLFQTPEYAQHIIGQSIAMHGIPDDLEEGVQARMERQKILYRPGHRFHFILGEAALRALVCPPDVLMGQVDRLIAIATLPNVALGVVPFTAPLPKPSVNGFWIYGDKLVIVETFAAELSLIQPDEISLYSRVFGLMHEAAIYGRPAREVMTNVLDDLSARFFPERVEGSEQ